MQATVYRQITSITAAPAVTVGAYSTGHLVGTKITLAGAALASGYAGVIRSVVARIKNGSVPGLDIFFFKADPSATTFTDNSAVAINVADLPNIIGVAQIVATTGWQLSAASTNSVAMTPSGLYIPFVPASGATTIYAAVVSRSTFTPGSTSDFSLEVFVE